MCTQVLVCAPSQSSRPLPAPRRRSGPPTHAHVAALATINACRCCFCPVTFANASAAVSAELEAPTGYDVSVNDSFRPLSRSSTVFGVRSTPAALRVRCASSPTAGDRRGDDCAASGRPAGRVNGLSSSSRGACACAAPGAGACSLDRASRARSSRLPLIVAGAGRLREAKSPALSPKRPASWSARAACKGCCLTTTPGTRFVGSTVTPAANGWRGKPTWCSASHSLSASPCSLAFQSRSQVGTSTLPR